MISFVTTGTLKYYFDQAKDSWWKYKGLNWRWKVKLWTASGTIKNCRLVWSQDLVTWNEGSVFDITSTPVFHYLDFYDLKGFKLDESISNIFVGIKVPGLPDNPAGITFYLDDYSLLATLKDSNWYLGNSVVRSRDTRATSYFLNYWTGGVKTDKEKQYIQKLSDRFMVAHGDVYLRDRTILGQILNYVSFETTVFNVPGSDFGGLRGYKKGDKVYCSWFDYTTVNLWYGILNANDGSEYQSATNLGIVWSVEPYPDLVVDDNYVYLFWSDWFSSGEIYFSKRNLNGSQVTAPVVLFSGGWDWVSVDFCDNGSAIMLGLIKNDGGVWKLYQAKVDLNGNILMNPVLVYTVGSSYKPSYLNIVLDEEGYVNWQYSLYVVNQVWYGKTNNIGGVVVSFRWLGINAILQSMDYDFLGKFVIGAYSVWSQVRYFVITKDGYAGSANVDFPVPVPSAEISFVALDDLRGYVYNYSGIYDRFIFKKVGDGDLFDIIEIEQISSGFVDGIYVLERNASNQIRFGGGSWVNLNGDGYYECVDSANIVRGRFFIWQDLLLVGSFNIDLRKAIKGEIGSFSGISVNLDLVSRPSHFSYLMPSVQSEYKEDLIIYESGGNYYGDLSYKSLQDGILIRDGVPIPEDKWTFVADNKIQLDSSEFDSDAKYEIRYKVKIEYESSVIDLGVNFNYLVWRPFWYIWNRKELFGYKADREEMLNFDFNRGEAELKFMSDGIKENSELVEYFGNNQRVVNSDNWNFINDNRGLRVNVRELNSQARYVFRYKVLVPRREEGAYYTVELSYSDNNITYSNYFSVELGQVLEYHRYWKYRVRFFDVKNKEDIRLRSLVLVSYQWRREI